MAGTVLVEHLVWWADTSLAACSSTWATLGDSLVEFAVLAGSVLHDSLSDVAVVWAALGSVSLSSGECWAIHALAIGRKLLSVVTFSWDASLSILGSSGEWVAVSTGSIDLKDLSSIADQ